jgi:hypothetical protein
MAKYLTILVIFLGTESFATLWSLGAGTRSPQCSDQLAAPDPYSYLMRHFGHEVTFLRENEAWGLGEPKPEEVLVATSEKTGDTFLVVEKVSGRRLFPFLTYFTHYPRRLLPWHRFFGARRSGSLLDLDLRRQGTTYSLSDGRRIEFYPTDFGRSTRVWSYRVYRPGEWVETVNQRIAESKDPRFRRFLGLYRAELATLFLKGYLQSEELIASNLRIMQSRKSHARFYVLFDYYQIDQRKIYYFSFDGRPLSGELGGPRFQEVVQIDEATHGTVFDLSDEKTLYLDSSDSAFFRRRVRVTRSMFR